MLARRLITKIFFFMLAAIICGWFIYAQTEAQKLLTIINSHYSTDENKGGFSSLEPTNEELDIYTDAMRDWHLTPGHEADISGILSINRIYLGRLCYTLVNALAAAIIVLSLIYCLAFLRDYFHVRGFTKAAAFIVTPFDLIPYILWIFPILAITRLLFSIEPLWDNGYQWDFFISTLNQTLIYAGFCMFLIPFFLNEITMKLKENASILVSERLLGLPFWAIYIRAFRILLFRQVCVRQIFYSCLFMMLLDFSFMTIHNFNQSESLPTIFRSASSYLEQQREKKEVLKLETAVPYKDLVLLFETTNLYQLPADLETRDVFDKRRFTEILRALEELRGWAGTLKSTDPRLANLSNNILLKSFQPSVTELELNFASKMLRYYTRMNTCFILALFFVVFFGFDRKRLFHA